MDTNASIHDTKEKLKSGSLTASELVDQSLDTIKKTNPKLNSILEIFDETARKKASSIDEEGYDKPLQGIPVAVKDMIATSQGKTTAASKILERFESPYQATVVNKLEEAGAIVIGKANLDEFAMGSTNEYSAYGPVTNPWDTSKAAGGSSGGSAASVAARQVFASLGTDTGGSIRNPASACGVVGLKPTYGRVSRFGAIAYASSFDQVGPITRTVKDNALLLEILAGQDKYDATTSDTKPGKYTQACGKSIEGMKIGIPKEYFGEEVDPDIAKTIKDAINELQDMGAQLVDISLPLMEAAVPTYYLLVKAEASSNLARYDGLRYGELDVETDNLIEHYMEVRGKNFGPEVKRSILMGTYALSAGYVDAWYKQASKVRTLIREEFKQAFSQVDVIAGPVLPEAAFEIGSKTTDPLKMYLADLLSVPASVAGLPAISTPAGFTKNMPIGMQLIAPHFQEEKLYQVAHAYEEQHDWHTKAPSITEES